MNVLVVAAGPAGGWPVAEALGQLPGVGQVERAAVPDPAGRADLDPVLDRLAGRRLVVAGSPAAFGDLLTRLLRRDELDIPVAVIRDLADLAAAARTAVTGRPRPADLVRDDHGGVLTDRAEVVAWRGGRLGMRAYLDATLVADGEVGGLAVVRTGTGVLRARLRPARRGWPARPARDGDADVGAGRAVQLSCAEARLTVDGRSHPRPVTRRNWWVEPDRWLLLESG